MKKAHKARAFVLCLSLCAFFAPELTHADTLISQNAYNTDIAFDGATRMRVGQTFQLNATTTIRAIVMVGELCYTSSVLGIWRTGSSMPSAGGIAGVEISSGPASYDFSLGNQTSLGTFEGFPETRWSDASGITLGPGHYVFGEGSSGACVSADPEAPLNSTSLSYAAGRAMGLYYASGSNTFRYIDTFLETANVYGGDVVFKVCDSESCNISGFDSADDISWDLITIKPPIDWGAVQFVATSSSLFSDIGASSTLASIADRCDDSSNLFSRGLCWAGSYLFIPDPRILESYSSLAREDIPSKFPFSWVFDVSSALLDNSGTGPLVATSTISIGYASTTLSSTGPFSTILPNITVFSEASVKHYIPTGVWNAMQALMIASLWLILGFDIYSTIRRRHAHV